MQVIYFEYNSARFIIQTPQSKIGYSYPRIFIADEKGFHNWDLSLNHIFGMTEQDFQSWLDDVVTLTTDEEKRAALKEVGVNADLFFEVFSEKKGE